MIVHQCVKIKMGQSTVSLMGDDSPLSWSKIVFSLHFIKEIHFSLQVIYNEWQISAYLILQSISAEDYKACVT